MPHAHWPDRLTLRRYCRYASAWSLLCLVCISPAFAGTSHGAIVSFLHPQGPIAADQAQHFDNVILIMLIVVLPVLIGTPLIAWRYRYGNKKARYAPNWDHANWIEVLIWGAPLAIVVIMAVWQAHDTTMLDPYRPLKATDPPLKVDVIGYDWKWLFVYPQLHIASVGQLVFPEHRALDLRLTSDSVMQSFLIPALGSQIYAMAAMQTRLHLIADSTGQFLGENTQYDGMGFQHEKFVAHATTPAGFRDWVARVKATGVPLTASSYNVVRADNTAPEIRAALNTAGMPPGAVFFNHVNPKLFHNVMMSFHGGKSTSAAIVGTPPKHPHMKHRMHIRPSIASLEPHWHGHHNAATE
jgi:cytochrome o ubiquinol oxidase subunit II